MRPCLLLIVFAIALTLNNPTIHAQTSSKIEGIVRYDLNVKVLPTDQRIEVNGTMQLPAPTKPEAFVEVSLTERMQDLKVEVISVNGETRTARVEKTRTEGGWLTQDGTPNNDAVYRVYPNNPFAPAQQIKLKFSYAGGGQMGFMYYIGPEVSFVSAYGTTWYPQFKDGRGVGSLTISVPAGEAAIAVGDRVSSKRDEAQGTFQFRNQLPTRFSFAAGKYTIVRRDGSIPVSVYLLRSRENMPQYLEAVQKTMKVLEEEFGPYRFKEFALVEVPRALAQKAGFNAATMQGFAYINSNAFNVPASRFNVLLEWYGHEFSHEWWPHVVSMKRPGGRFMEEMLAEYGGSRAVETLAGPDPAERYRRQGYEPDPIYSALEYFKLVRKGIDGKLGDLPADEKVRDIAYNKGFLVWGMLSREIGRKKFKQVLRRITRRYAFRQLTFKEFWREIEAGAGRDLSWFYQQWFDRTGAPDFQLEWKQEGRTVHGTITQTAPYYRVTLPVEIQGDDGQRVVRNVKVTGARINFAAPVKFHVRSVTLDPHYVVLRWTPEYHRISGQ